MRWDRLSAGFTTWVFASLCLVSPEGLGPAVAWSRTDVVEDWEKRRIEAIAIAMPATIGVFGPDGQGGGSGVVISSNGYALTNYHVIESCDSFMKCSMPDGRLYDAVIVGIESDRGLGDDQVAGTC